jgi:HEAT repeat protein
VSTDRITCKACGTPNDVTAFACSGCGASLVADGQERWAAARVRDRVLDADATAALDRAATVRNVAVGLVGLAILGVVLTFTLNWYNRNHYLLGEPRYANEPAAHWAAVLVESDDHYMRRRAALAIESIADRLNERTAYAIVPSLKGALEDEDEEVRRRARTALDTIEQVTGVQ